MILFLLSNEDIACYADDDAAAKFECLRNQLLVTSVENVKGSAESYDPVTKPVRRRHCELSRRNLSLVSTISLGKSVNNCFDFQNLLGFHTEECTCKSTRGSSEVIPLVS